MIEIFNLFVCYTANLNLPGPGHYRINSEFDSNQYIKSMDEKGTYISKENGHMNQKKQIYSKFDGSARTIANSITNSKAKLDHSSFLKDVNSLNPGPGHYETNLSSCVSTEFTRKMKNNLSKSKLLTSNMKQSGMSPN